MRMRTAFFFCLLVALVSTDLYAQTAEGVEPSNSDALIPANDPRLLRIGDLKVARMNGIDLMGTWRTAWALSVASLDGVMSGYNSHGGLQLGSSYTFRRDGSLIIGVGPIHDTQETVLWQWKDTEQTLLLTYRDGHAETCIVTKIADDKLIVGQTRTQPNAARTDVYMFVR